MSVNQQGKRPMIVGVGLGRTGTKSLQAALEMLGFGPVYHMTTILHKGDPEEFNKWRKFAEGKGRLEDMHEILEGFGGVVDYPGAMFAGDLYKAYPEGKFILTVRDPAKWEKSMKDTVLNPSLRKAGEHVPIIKAVAQFMDEVGNGWYHHGHLMDDTQSEFLRHTEHVKSVIPAEQLLVYEVGEGWDRLVEFLQVPKPKEDFPRINDSAQFKQNVDTYIATGVFKDPASKLDG